MTKLRSKISKKTFDPAGEAWDSGCTHGKKEHTHMKKTLVIAAAALTLGVLSASAQSNVYSLNIVGYVNTVIKGNGEFTLLANPLDAPTNTSVALVGGLLPNKSQVLTWNGASYDTASKIAGVWNTNFNLPVGTGFFVKNGPVGSPALTNTFVGNVLGALPGTNSTSLPAGFILAGAKTPVGGLLTDTGANTLNLGAVLANKSQVLVWDNSGPGSYTTASKIAGAWNTNLTLSVGQGFFIKAFTAGSNWVQILQ